MNKFTADNDLMLWVDIETTGLNENDPLALILEVGYAVTRRDLTLVARDSWIVHDPYVHKDDYDPFIQEMHGSAGTGLFEQCRNNGWALNLIDLKIHSMIGSLWENEKPPLCGSSVQFDRKWIEAYMPMTASALHYRNVDVSAIREFARRWRPDIDESVLTPQGLHRVHPDLDDTIELARFYKTKLFDQKADTK